MARVGYKVKSLDDYSLQWLNINLEPSQWNHYNSKPHNGSILGQSKVANEKSKKKIELKQLVREKITMPMH